MVLVASVYWRVRILSGPPSRPTIMAASGRLGQALVMRQSTVAFESISSLLCSRNSHLESDALLPCVPVSGSHCSARLGVDCENENWDFREMPFFVGAILGLTVDTCSASVLVIMDEFHTFSTLRQTWILMRFFSIRFEWRSVPTRCFWLQFFALRGSHLEHWTYFYEFHLVELRDDRQGFSLLSAAFFSPGLPINTSGIVDENIPTEDRVNNNNSNNNKPFWLKSPRLFELHCTAVSD